MPNASSSACPDADQLRALIEDCLPEVERDRLLTHVDRCEACQRRLEMLIGNGAIPGMVGQRVERSPFSAETALFDAMARLKHGPAAAVADRFGAGGLLEPPAAPLGSNVDLAAAEFPLAERPGSIIGPYKLLEQIGEGGMGVVFMAEQAQPIQRKVALKIIKPGMDTREVIARFEAERQALALMDHPNIAHVVDAGATETGRPYFVMELVRGVPITDYCDQQKLGIRERLALFVTICQAVQHAHQKGIIHRDLKPTNVLVTLHDGRPVIKVIDFGVAKATGQKLTDKTLFTGFAQLIGTPLYMSPEQAEMSGLDVDTRSDIYSLGVLLYELLTGSTPFDSQRLKASSVDELRRIIREEEPPRPSTRLSTLTQEARSTVSERRSSDPRQLSRLFEGELDWIVMKAMEKDRTRRYETASALADDMERYLADEPVLACPPSTAYRFHKFARRNRVALLTTTAVMVALLSGILFGAWMAVRAYHSALQAQASAEKAHAAAMVMSLTGGTDFQEPLSDANTSVPDPGAVGTWEVDQPVKGLWVISAKKNSPNVLEAEYRREEQAESFYFKLFFTRIGSDRFVSVQRVEKDDKGVFHPYVICKYERSGDDAIDVSPIDGKFFIKAIESGQLKGQPLYDSPELIERHSLDVTLDVAVENVRKFIVGNGPKCFIDPPPLHLKRIRQNESH